MKFISDVVMARYDVMFGEVVLRVTLTDNTCSLTVNIYKQRYQELIFFLTVADTVRAKIISLRIYDK